MRHKAVVDLGGGWHKVWGGEGGGNAVSSLTV